MSDKPDEIKPQFQEALEKLEEHAKLLHKTEPRKHHLSMMRNKAWELSVGEDVRDDQLKAILKEAEVSLAPSKCYAMGEALSGEAPVFLIEGLAIMGQLNMICGEAKVGKSSFACSLLASLNDKRADFLGREILETPSRLPLLVFGTDQTEGDWIQYLQRENLIDDDKKLTGLDFFCSAEGVARFNFTDEGIEQICQVVARHEFPVVVIDSLSAMMEPTDISEVDDAYGTPLRKFMNRMGVYGATTIVIHHTKKDVKSWDWVKECRGTGKISHIPSWGVLMRFVSGDDIDAARVDTRVGFSAKGRLAAPAQGLMAQYMGEEGWKPLGSLEGAQAANKTLSKIASLGQTVRASVFDYITQRTFIGAAGTSQEASLELNKKQQNVSRELRLLETSGLITCIREESAGGRPQKFYQLSKPAIEALDPSYTPRIDISDTNPLNTNNINNIAYTCGKPPEEKISSFQINDPVEVNKGGDWKNGYIVVNNADPGFLVVAKKFDLRHRLNNQRPGLDIRPCKSAFTSTPDPLDF